MMVSILIVFFLETLLYVCGSPKTYCPVSAYSLQDGYHSYPLDIFAHELLLQPYTNNLKLLDCFAYYKQTKWPNMTKYTCLSNNHSICPIKDQFIAETMKISRSTMNYPSLCKITEAIKNDVSKVNVIVLGGSVTSGVATDGCNTNKDCMNGPNSHDRFHNCQTCAWPNYLGMWIRKVLFKDVALFNLGLSGATSGYMSDQLSRMFQRNNISVLTGNDIIFIDHSTNNFFDVAAPLLDKRIAMGLESLVRKLYSLSDPHSFPTIIILATETIQPSAVKHPSNNLTHAYMEVSRHYRIPLWSLDDLYHSSYLQRGNFTFTKHITRQYNADSRHPGWMVHLFDADLIAAIMTQELGECGEMTERQRRSLMHEEYLNEISQLPPPLHNQSNNDDCESADTVLSVSYDNLGSGKDTASWKSTPLNAWQLRLDTNNRGGGFIWEYSSNDTVDGAELTFTLPLTKKEFNAAHRNLTVKLTVLRTYENAGADVVSFCGNNATLLEIDALWGDFDTYKFSLPTTCRASLRDCPPHNSSSGPVTVTFRHLARTDSIHVRRNQKFKLLDIEICFQK